MLNRWRWLEGSCLGFRSISHSKTDTDRKSTRLNSSHSQISYAVFCLKKKNHAQALVLQLHLVPSPTPCNRALDAHRIDRARDGLTYRADLSPLRPTRAKPRRTIQSIT